MKGAFGGVPSDSFNGNPAPAPASDAIVDYGKSVLGNAKLGVNQAIAGYNQAAAAKNPVDLLEGSAALAAGGINTLASPLAPVLKPVGDTISKVGETVGNIPAVQKFANSPRGDVTARVAEDVGNLATIAGGVAPFTGAPEAVAPGIISKTLGKVDARLGQIPAAPASEVLAKPASRGVLDSVVAKPIPKAVQSVLKETPTNQFDNYVNLAKSAVESNKNTTPLEYAGTRAQTALDQIQRKLSTIGSQKSAVINSAAGREPVGNIALKFRQDLQNNLSTKTAVEGDTKLIRDVSSEAQKLGSNPSAAQVDKFIDFVQDRIYTGQRDLTVPVTDGTVALLRNITGKLNSSLKAKLPESYRTLNQKYADLVGTRNELNLKLGPSGEKGGALMKRVFSPSDANTKNLFAAVKKHTGIDLVNEATIAKHVMEVLGDARQQSMLEQFSLHKTTPSASGLVSRAVDYGISKLNSPEAQIARARAMTRAGGLPRPK